MRHLSVLVLFSWALFLLHPSLVGGANIEALPTLRGEGPVEIEADELSFEKEGQRYEGHGHVEVTRGNLTLKADHAQLSMATKDLMAWGNIILRDGEDVLECDRLEINLDTRLGKVYQARLFMKDQNVHITGREAEKLGENRYRVIDGTFTTCDAERPPWKFSMKELEVTLKGWAFAKGPVFYLEDIPVLYLPVGAFPLNRERHTGFLLPQLGYSDKYGPEVRQSFFWAISENMDATFSLDRLGDNRGRGFQEGLEYRYAFTKDTKGEVNLYYIDDQVYNSDRYAAFYKHQQKLPYDFYLKGDMNYVSDNDYPRDFSRNLSGGTSLDARSMKETRSVLFGGKDWEHFSFLAEAMAFQNLTQPSNDQTVQKLPQVSFFAHPQTFLGSPLFFNLSSSYVNFWREEGVQAQRWDLLPALSLPLRLLDVVKLESSVGFRETFYRTHDDPSGQLDKWESRESPETAVQMATEFYRTYPASSSSWISNLFGVSKWMHTVEPLVGYRYNLRVDQDDLPLFDDLDRIPYNNQINYGFTQRLIGKPVREGVASGPIEYAKLKIFQGYSLGDPFERDGKGKTRYFSDVVGDLWWRFSPYMTGSGEIGISPYDGKLKRLNGLITLRDKRDDALRIEYRNTRDDYSQTLNFTANSMQTVYSAGGIETIDLTARLKLMRSLYLFGSMSYNIQDRTSVDKTSGLEYQAQCWAAGVVAEQKGGTTTSFGTKETTFQVYFNLLGIGLVGNRPGPLSF
jgi:LPS-assembly protein